MVPEMTYSVEWDVKPLLNQSIKPLWSTFRLLCQFHCYSVAYLDYSLRLVVRLFTSVLKLGSGFRVRVNFKVSVSFRVRSRVCTTNSLHSYGYGYLYG